MSTISEDELFTTSVATLLGSDTPEYASLIRQFSSAQRDEASRLIAEVLTQEGDAAGISTIEQSLPKEAVSTFKSIVYREQSTGQPNKILIFRTRDAIADSWLAILGVAVAVFGPPSVGTLVQIVAVVTALWKKFLLLKRPQDADAIDVVETLVKLKAKSVAAGSPQNTTTKSLKAVLNRLAENDLDQALHKLIDLKVIEVTTWGDQAGNLDHPENRWQIRF